MKATVKNMYFNGLVTFLNGIFPLIIIPLITEKISAEHLGEILFSDNLGKYISIFSLVGLPVYGVRTIARGKNHNDQKNIFKELLSLNILFTSITLFIYIIYHLLFFSITKINIYIIVIILTNSFLFEWAYFGLEKFKIFATRIFIIKCITILLIFFCIKTDNDSNLLLSIFCLSYFLSSIISIFFLIKHFGNFFDEKLNFIEPLRKHGKQIFLIFTSILFSSIYMQIDTIILGLLSTKKAVAIYSIGQKVPKAASMLICSITSVLIPKQSVNINNDREKYIKTFSTTFKIVIILGGLIGIFNFIYCDVIIELLANKSYVSSTAVLKILSIVPMITGLSNLYIFHCISLLNKDKLNLLVLISGAIASICLNLILVPNLGEIGASISLFVTESVIGLAAFIFSFKLIENKFLNSDILFIFLKLILLLLITKFIISIEIINVYFSLFIFALLTILFFFKYFLSILKFDF